MGCSDDNKIKLSKQVRRIQINAKFRGAFRFIWLWYSSYFIQVVETVF